jgi:hypothetical protein
LAAIKELPLGPIELAWYMLAQAEIASGEDLGIVKSLHERLEKGPVPIFEVMLRSKWMERAVTASDAQVIAEHLRPWLDGTAYMRAEGRSLRERFTVLDPPRGEVPSLQPSQLTDEFVQASAGDAILAFLIVSILRGGMDAPSLLESQLTAQLGSGFSGSAIFDRWKGKQAVLSPVDQVTIKALLLLKEGDHLEPIRIWEIGLRLFEKAKYSNFKMPLTPALAEWMRIQWSRIISEERFRLPHPMMTVPDVETALSNKNNDTRFVAALCLSAADAVEAPLAQDYRQELERLTAAS